MSTKKFTAVPYSGYGSQGLQVFTPREVVTTTTLDTTDVNAIRIAAEVGYNINGAGTQGTMPAGCTGIASGVTSIVFTEETTVEIM